jgi:hypothetical protein
MIFISYKRQSFEFASNLEIRLRHQGFVTFLDEQIDAGELWKEVIDNALAQSTAVVVVVTPEALRSQYVTYEWSYALGMRKKIVPLILEPLGADDPKLHPRLDDRNYRNFQAPTAADWDRLFADLHRIEDQYAIPQILRRADNTLETSHLPEHWRSAVAVLQNHPAPTSVDILAKHVNNPIEEISVLAGLALTEKMQGSDAQALPGVAMGLRQQEHRSRALEALVAIGGIAASEAIIKSYRELNDKDQKIRLIRALGRINNEISINFLEQLIEENDEANAIAAAQAIGDLQSVSSVPKLVIIVTEGKNNDLRRAAISALIEIGDRSAAEPLLNLLKEFDPRVPGAPLELFGDIIRSFGTLGTPEILKWMKTSRNHTMFHFFENQLVNAIRLLEDKLNK